jgi:hypothetical protein
VVTRARQRVTNGKRMPASSTQHERLLDAFLAAARHGDVAGLEGPPGVARRFHRDLRSRGMRSLLPSSRSFGALVRHNGAWCPVNGS